MQNVLWLSVFVAGLAGLSHGQRINLPGGLFYDVEVSDAPCLEVAKDFQEEFVDSDRDSVCSQFGAGQWTKYRGGYVGTFFSAINTSTSLDHCLQLAAGQIVAEAMCHHVDRLKDTCVCDQLVCVTEVTNREMDRDELLRCSGFGKKMCVHLSGAISTACRGVIDNPATGTGVQFDQSRVPRDCDQSRCRSALETSTTTTTRATRGATSGAPRMATILGGGVYLAGAVVVAWVVSMVL